MYGDQRLQKPSTTGDFEFLNKLGQGSFGVVYKVRRKADKGIYVMKQINIAQMSHNLRKEALNEVKILSSLNNDYIVKYYESFIEKNYLNIVMEYCEGGDLANLIKNSIKTLPESKIWKFLIQICIGLAYVHGKKVLHRDIKSMNIFLSKSEDVRIGDLGVAKALAETHNFAHTMIGTPYYLSPEMCEEKPYNSKSDMWAVGCVLYEMCTKRHPFEATNQAALVLKIINGKYAPISPIYSPEITQILNLLLNRDYKKRPGASTLLSRADLRGKAKALQISLGDEKEGEEAEVRKEKPSISIDQGLRPDLVSKRHERQVSKPSSNWEAIQAGKRDKSPVASRLEINQPISVPNIQNKIITPSNVFKSKTPSNNLRNKEESSRSKSPLNEISPRPIAAAAKKAGPIDGNDRIFPKPVKDKSPGLPPPRELPKSNQDRNIKRIRKGAPQVLGRQAVNAAQQRVPNPDLKRNPSAVQPPELVVVSKSKSQLTEEDQVPVSKVDRKARGANPWLERDVSPQPQAVEDKPEREPSPEAVLVTPTYEVVEIDSDPEETNEKDEKNEIDVQPVIYDVKAEKEREEEKEQHVEKKEEIHDVNDDVPVMFEVNTVDPETHFNNNDDDDDEDHEYWDSNEDEEEYQKDDFENEDDEEEEKAQKEKCKSGEYEEDFESDEETEATDKSQVSASHDSRETILKKMDKAKKEKELVEKLLQERSLICTKQIGENTFEEIMSFLKMKIGVSFSSITDL